MRTCKEIFRANAIFDDKGVLVAGTDREVHHSYGDAYDSLLSDYRRLDAKFVMEVGIADGAGLRSFAEIFPNATIVGLDRLEDGRRYGERLEYHIGDQRSREACEKAANGRMFDLIVDDGMHELSANLLSLFWLWPYVRGGGLYVIEEMEGVCGLAAQVKLFGGKMIDTPCPFGGNEPLVVIRRDR